MVIAHLRRTHCKPHAAVKLNHLHGLYILDETAFLECVSDVCVYMSICYNLALLFHVLCVFENLLY